MLGQRRLISVPESKDSLLSTSVQKEEALIDVPLNESHPKNIAKVQKRDYLQTCANVCVIIGGMALITLVIVMSLFMSRVDTIIIEDIEPAAINIRDTIANMTSTTNVALAQRALENLADTLEIASNLTKNGNDAFINDIGYIENIISMVQDLLEDANTGPISESIKTVEGLIEGFDSIQSLIKLALALNDLSETLAPTESPQTNTTTVLLLEERSKEEEEPKFKPKRANAFQKLVQ